MPEDEEAKAQEADRAENARVVAMLAAHRDQLLRNAGLGGIVDRIHAAGPNGKAKDWPKEE